MGQTGKVERRAMTGPDSTRGLRNGWWLGVGLTAAMSGVALLPNAATGQETAKPVPVPPEAAAFFESKIRPVLAESCISCHGKDAQLGGLRVDSREFLIKGGVSGTALIPGDPEKSLLIQAIRHTGKLKMPQGGKLKDEEITALTEWVKMGAPWPASSVATPAKPAAPHWSFIPVRKPAVPKVKNIAWVANPIDAFVLAKLEAKGFTPNPAADRRTLIRRVTYDLIGLPPTYQETEAFLADKSPNAYEKVVDRLLASPRYGERWGRHWLDVARYADTKGYVFTEDRNYYNAYTYREWVIRSLNEDLPYNKFIVEQLAADRLPEVQNGDDKRSLAALGFLTVGRRFLNNRADIMDDRIDVTMRGFQGLTVACARCHDHKFDPVPTIDYYSLYGIFDNTDEATPAISARAISEPYEKHEAEVRAADEKATGILRAQIGRLRKMVGDPAQTATVPAPAKDALQGFRENELPNDKQFAVLEPLFEPAQRDELKQTKERLGQLRGSYPQKPEFAMAVVDRANCTNGHVFKRGNPGNPGDEAPRRFLSALTPEGKERTLWTKGSGRLELAEAIASPENPLTARVMVNRVWLQHFGGGIVRTPSDFGRQGEKPTHPELLDWMSANFVEQGWSLKKLHKTMVMSSTYRQTSVITPKMETADPENRLWGRANLRRLDLEQTRDSLLVVTGQLDVAQVGGKSVDIWAQPFAHRRAVYGFVERQNLPQVFKTFDFASPDSTNGQRFRTTVPQQALFLMNGPFAIEQARQLSNMAEQEKATDNSQRVRRMYLRVFGRLPDADELKIGVAFLNLPDPVVTGAAAPTWQYGYGGYSKEKGAVSFTALPFFNGKSWQGGENMPDAKLGWASLNAEGGHPGGDQDHAVIRRWTAPRDMTVTVNGTIKRPEAQGDGVRARIVSSRRGQLGEWTALNGEAKTEVAQFEVKAGETVDFIVDPIANEGFDGFTWMPTIRVVGTATGGPTRWEAKREFSGPASPPLKRREMYAQALLMTNEFLFVD